MLQMVLTCRFYASRYPEPDDVVMVNVRQIADMGAYVHLLEYDNIEGEFHNTICSLLLLLILLDDSKYLFLESITS